MSDPTVAHDYAALNRELAASFRDDRNAYTEGKIEFIGSALQG